eukprot:249592-Pyramimonas_sp.AAC.1
MDEVVDDYPVIAADRGVHPINAGLALLPHGAPDSLARGQHVVFMCCFSVCAEALIIMVARTPTVNEHALSDLEPLLC